MIDIQIIRDNPQNVIDDLEKLNSTAPIEEIVELDKRRRSILNQVEELKHLRNKVSKNIGRMSDKDERDKLITEMREVSQKIQGFDRELDSVESDLKQAMLWVPNLPHSSVPVGQSEDENIVVWTHGEKHDFDFEPKPHWDLGPELDIIDFERGVKIAGTRFYLLKGNGARLQRALIQFMLDLHVNSHKYKEVIPPYMVRREMMFGAGQLPKFEGNIYHDVEDDFWWIGTAEIALTNIHREEILDASNLPVKYVAHTPCFRREKMSAGRDTRGIKRGHQFDKVELYQFTRPEESYQILDQMIEEASKVCELLKIPYRLVEACTGDLGFHAAKKLDLEMWSPGCNEWLEVSSLSNCEDFQARRSAIRFRRERGSKPEHVHTINGSGLAVPRVMIAIMENYQNEDGNIDIPEVLQPYMGGMEKIHP
ncbi:MAG: serine--tRNA ligase [Chloroflexota bacterium]